MIAVHFGGQRLDHGLGDLPNRGAEGRVIGCKFEIQVRRYLE